jgi:Helix-turn-helix of DDE superfamily endonuclease
VTANAGWVNVGTDHDTAAFATRGTSPAPAGHPSSFPDRVVATVLHLRLSLPDDTLAHLFGTSRTTIGRALAETRHLLDQRGHRIEPVTAPPDLPARIPPYIPRTDDNPEDKAKEAC